MTEFGKQSEKDQRPTSSARNTEVGRYADAVVIEHLKACQKVAVEQSRKRFEDFEKALEEKLLEFVDKAKTNQDHTRYQEMVREFRQQGTQLLRHFIGYLGEGFIKFKNGELNTRTGEEKYRRDMLSLVDNQDLEETIAISSVTHRAEERYGELLWALNQRYAMLVGADKVDEGGNPSSPVQFCESLRKALKVVHVDTKAKIIAYKVFDKEFVSHLQDVLEETNNYLIKSNILPNLRYVPGTGDSEDDVALPTFNDEFPKATPAQTPTTPPVNAAATAPTRQPLPSSGVVNAPNPNGPTEQYQSELVNAIRVLQNHIAADNITAVNDEGGAAIHAPPSGGNGGPTPASGGAYQGGGAAAPAGAASHQVRTFTNQQLVNALQGLQMQALSVTQDFVEDDTGVVQAVPSQNISLVAQQLTQQLQDESEDGEVAPVDMHTIELVGMLFEYMLSDDHLPDSVKAILSYLHTPFLKVAFIDKDFFEETQHPARLLLNSLAESGARWVSNDGSSQYEIYTKIKQTVSRVLDEFKNDVRLFAELLLEFSSYVNKIARRHELMEKRAMEKVQGEEKLREVKIRVNKEIRSRTDNKELPSAVLLLLLQPWSDYMAFLLLRYGEESDSWKKAIKAIDDILWSIEPKNEQVERTKQMDLHDDLLDLIEAGFETIGYDQTKGKKLIEAVVSLQKLALQSVKAEPAPAPMRDKLESMAAEKAGDHPEQTDDATPEEAKMVENLKMIEFGTWFEFEGGKRLKVAWYNSKTMHYMLVDQMGKKVAMRSGLELARAMISGTARVIAGSTKPFFERALENIFQNLNAKAEAIKPEAADG